MQNFMRVTSLVLAVCLTGLLLLGAVGCSEEGPAEKAGKKIDEAMDSAKEKANEIFK